MRPAGRGARALGWSPCSTASTRSSARCRSPPSPTPRSIAPATAVPNTPTSGSSGSSPRRSRCATGRSPASSTRRWSGWPSGCSSTGSGASPRTVDLTPERAAATAEQAVEVARTLAPVARERVERAAEPVHADAVWVSAYALDPFDVPTRDKVALLTEWSRRLLASDGVDHVQAGVAQVRECKFYADLAGTSTLQQRVRIAPTVTATAVDRASGGFETMDSLAAPAGRGWEYLTGDGWDFDAELATIPELLAEKVKAPSVGRGPLRPGHRPDQPLAHHPRVRRARHRVRPRHRLRGRLRGHQLRHARQARHAALRLGPDARHRRPHDRQRPGHRRLRRRRRADHRLGPRARGRARRLSARPHLRPPPRPRPAPTAAPSPTPRTTCRSSGWPTSRCSPTPPATPAPTS